MPSTAYNERSWAIDLIGVVKQYVNAHALNVRGAGGERTLRDQKGTLFPDVLLFGDTAGERIVQGWELKMPDTPVTDGELLANAARKARTLRLNSFLVWNVDTAVLHVADEDLEAYYPEKEWSLSGGPTGGRTHVKSRRKDWEALAYTILHEVDRFLEDGVLRDRTVVEALSEQAVIEAIFGGTSETKEYLQEAIARDGVFDAHVTEWWNSVHEEHPSGDRMSVLARQALTSWTGKVVFAHVLKSAYREARVVEEVGEKASADEALHLFERISQACNFLNIFQKQLGEAQLPTSVWTTFAQFSDFLSDLDIETIGADTLDAMLHSTASAVKRKSAGQYTTPPALAQVLVRVALNDKSGTFFDPFCGTGTIPRAAYEVKREYNQPPAESLASLWASDKFSFPVQMATLALARPSHMGRLLHIFQSDVVDLQPGRQIQFQNPDTGQPVTKELPKADCIASNLPFVQFEDLEERNPTIRRLNERLGTFTDEEIHLPSKCDLYAYLPFYLWILLDDGGRTGLVLSNAWLGTNWGAAFQRLLLQFYHIEKVVVSGHGRWFRNADVVTSLVFLQKRSAPAPPDGDEKTAFITLEEPLDALAGEDDMRALTADLILEKSASEWATIHRYKHARRQRLENLGLTWNSLFADVGWLLQAEEQLTPVGDLFGIKRGERRGWNAMFYPEAGHGIEDNYIERVLRTPANVNSLIATPETEAFCCSQSVEVLRRRGDRGALAWIRKFEHETNTRGEPLPNVLARSDLHWYEMPAGTMADLVLPLNPYRRLFIAKLHRRGFVDQRFTRFTRRDERIDIALCHALLNSLIGLFYIEALGFGRGLGALDLSTTKMRKRLFMLNPMLLHQEQKEQILQQFEPLLHRSVKPLPQELKQEDRRAFDRIVLEAFGLKELTEATRASLEKLFAIRMAAREER